ncbi:hypothetical protein [Paracoccus actinidiae]|uniref:hypothetical protein n=1 Tax=Paracoccus actinidiae TaxID=3064531 RepID=UPI0027D29FEA|nr:hypothetical protein [Paracoccus sp. M09]
MGAGTRISLQEVAVGGGNLRKKAGQTGSGAYSSNKRHRLLSLSYLCKDSLTMDVSHSLELNNHHQSVLKTVGHRNRADGPAEASAFATCPAMTKMSHRMAQLSDWTPSTEAAR